MGSIWTQPVERSENDLIDSPITRGASPSTHAARAPRTIRRAAAAHIWKITVLTQFTDLGLAKPLLKALADEGKLPATQVAEAIAKYGIKADKINPLYA